MLENNLVRRRVAKYSVLCIAFSGLLAVYFGYSLVGCLVGCQSGLLEGSILGAAVLVGFAGTVVALFNFFYQLYRFRWQGLLFWERLFLYMLVLFIAAYFVVHFYFA